MRRRLLVVGVIIGGLGALGWFVTMREGNACDVLAERELVDTMSDFGTSGARPSIEAAVESAFAEAGIPHEIDSSDLDPVIQGGGNLVHVGAHGYWFILAIVPGGVVPVAEPRPCSILGG